jgi:hypothetical protein
MMIFFRRLRLAFLYIQGEAGEIRASQLIAKRPLRQI